MKTSRPKRAIDCDAIDPGVLAAAKQEASIVRVPRLSRKPNWMLGVLAACLFFLMTLAYASVRQWIRSWDLLWLLVPILIAGIAAAGLIIWAITARRRERRLRKALSRRGVPICVECGYLLHGLELSAPCPECGSQRSAAD